MVTKLLHWQKIICGCFRCLWLWLLIIIMKRCADRCALQLHQTSLNRTFFLWTNLPSECKMATYLHDFKLKIQNWHYHKSVCGLCQTFQQSLWFLYTSDLINFWEKVLFAKIHTGFLINIEKILLLLSFIIVMT